MKIKTQINFRDYLKLQYILTYQNYITLFSMFLAFILLVLALLQFIGEIPGSDNVNIGLYLGLYIVISTPLFIYIKAKRNFKTHKALQEEITYGFFTDKFTIVTPYSNAEIPWEKMYKIRELNNWFLLYQSNRIANLIPKTSLTSEEISGVREILKNVKGIKVKLKAN
jgi:hypothetical protein